jgi:hypothetical protein
VGDPKITGREPNPTCAIGEVQPTERK